MFWNPFVKQKKSTAVSDRRWYKNCSFSSSVRKKAYSLYRRLWTRWLHGSNIRYPPSDSPYSWLQMARIQRRFMSSREQQRLGISSYKRSCARVNPLTAEWALRALIDFTLSNARRFYSSIGKPLDGEGLRKYVFFCFCFFKQDQKERSYSVIVVRRNSRPPDIRELK